MKLTTFTSLEVSTISPIWQRVEDYLNLRGPRLQASLGKESKTLSLTPIENPQSWGWTALKLGAHVAMIFPLLFRPFRSSFLQTTFRALRIALYTISCFAILARTYYRSCYTFEEFQNNSHSSQKPENSEKAAPSALGEQDVKRKGDLPASITSSTSSGLTGYGSAGIAAAPSSDLLKQITWMTGSRSSCLGVIFSMNTSPALMPSSNLLEREWAPLSGEIPCVLNSLSGVDWESRDVAISYAESEAFGFDPQNSFDKIKRELNKNEPAVDFAHLHLLRLQITGHTDLLKNLKPLIVEALKPKYTLSLKDEWKKGIGLIGKKYSLKSFQKKLEDSQYQQLQRGEIIAVRNIPEYRIGTVKNLDGSKVTVSFGSDAVETFEKTLVTKFDNTAIRFNGLRSSFKVTGLVISKTSDLIGRSDVIFSHSICVTSPLEVENLVAVQINETHRLGLVEDYDLVSKDVKVMTEIGKKLERIHIFSVFKIAEPEFIDLIKDLPEATADKMSLVQEFLEDRKRIQQIQQLQKWSEQNVAQISEEMMKSYVNHPFPIIWASTTLKGEEPKNAGKPGERTLSQACLLGRDIQLAFTQNEHISTLQTALKDLNVKVFDIQHLGAPAQVIPGGISC